MLIAQESRYGINNLESSAKKKGVMGKLVKN